MMISNLTASSVSTASNKVTTSTLIDKPTDGFGPEYQVEFSARGRQEGLALNQTATGIAESKMRNVLVRILLETLFGAKEQNKQETPEEELIAQVVEEPVMEEQLRQMSQ